MLRDGTTSLTGLPLVEAIVISLLRLVVGFVAGILLGSVFGTLMWRSRSADEFLGPLFLGLQTLPSVCWVPLALIVVGANERGMLFVMVLGSVFAISIALRDGLRGIPPIYQRAGAMLGTSGWRMYRYVLLPASLPALASTLRLGFSFAWRSLMGAEFIFQAVRLHGLGSLLQAGRSDVAQVVAVMSIMVLIGIVADRAAFGVLERRVHKRFGLSVAE
jgi:NitT/TauT family transport system permease protein